MQTIFENVMINFIKELVEEAKVSENHTIVKYMTYGEVMDAMKKVGGSFATFGKELSDYMERNGCSFYYVSERTMMPMVTVKYNGFETDCIFDGAEFGKVYMTRDGHKALYITKVSDKHKLCIENGDVSFYNGDGTHNCFNTSDDFDMPKRHIDYDIVGEWKEQIDEKELHNLADENNSYEFLGYYETRDADKLYSVFNEGFKMGYRKAKGFVNDVKGD